MTDPPLYVPKIFSVFVQARDLNRSLSLCQDVPGLEAERNDGTLAILPSRGDNGHTLLIREISDGARRVLGEAGLSRVAFRVTDTADLGRAEKVVAQHAVHCRRYRDGGAEYLAIRDPDGLRVVLFHADAASLTPMPPAFLTPQNQRPAQVTALAQPTERAGFDLVRHTQARVR